MKYIQLIQVVSLACIIPGVVAFPTSPTSTSRPHTNPHELNKRGFWNCFFDQCNPFRNPPPGTRTIKKETRSFDIDLPRESPIQGTVDNVYRGSREVFDTRLQLVGNGLSVRVMWNPHFDRSIASASILLELDGTGGPATFPGNTGTRGDHLYVSPSSGDADFVIPSATIRDAWARFHSEPHSSDAKPQLTIYYTLLTVSEEKELK